MGHSCFRDAVPTKFRTASLAICLLLLSACDPQRERSAELSPARPFGTESLDEMLAESDPRVSKSAARRVVSLRSSDGRSLQGAKVYASGFGWHELAVLDSAGRSTLREAKHWWLRVEHPQIQGFLTFLTADQLCSEAPLQLESRRAQHARVRLPDTEEIMPARFLALWRRRDAHRPVLRAASDQDLIVEEGLIHPRSVGPNNSLESPWSTDVSWTLHLRISVSHGHKSLWFADSGSGLEPELRRLPVRWRFVVRNADGHPQAHWRCRAIESGAPHVPEWTERTCYSNERGELEIESALWMGTPGSLRLRSTDGRWSRRIESRVSWKSTTGLERQPPRRAELIVDDDL